MFKENYLSIIDFGSSKTRITIFDSNLNIAFTQSLNKNLNSEDVQYFNLFKNIIKTAEKKISSHIDDTILIFDSGETFILEISLQKKFDKNLNFMKAYEILKQEIQQIINNNYNEYQIIHTIFKRGIIDNKLFNTYPNNIKNITEIKIDFKVICFPKIHIDKIEKDLNKNNLNVSKIFCSSFLKSFSYSNKLNLKKVAFLDIGYERTSFAFYKNNSLKYMQSIKIGSNHITKDISKIFKINIEDAEKIKKLFNKAETEFSYNNNKDEENISVKDILKKNISINLLKKVILYRVQEIFDLVFKKFEINNVNFLETELFLIGDGSILFNNNSFYLKDKFPFKSINYFYETDVQICNAALDYYINFYEKPVTKQKNQGLFERFFNLFEK